MSDFLGNPATVRAGAPATEQTRLYEGWWIVAVAFSCLMFTFGAPTLLLPMIFGPVIDEFGWSRTDATMIATYKFSAAAIGAVLIGPVIERLGLRVVILSASVVTGIAMVGFLWVHHLWQYYALGAVLGFTAIAVIISVKVMVSRWFSRNQGLAIGIALAGASFAGVIVPILAEPIIRHYDWRMAFAAVSLGIWIVALPFYLWKARETPSADEIRSDAYGVGQSDAAQPLGPSARSAVAVDMERAELDLTFSDILGGRMFWLIAASLFIVGLVDQGVTQNTVLYLNRDLGMGSRVAALGLSGTFALGIAAKVGSGWVYDKLSIRGIMACYYLLAIAVALALPIVGIATLVLFTVARGLAHGGLIADTAIFAKHCFGHRHMSKMIGILVGITTLGYATGPVLLAAIHDHFGSYRYGFILYAVLAVLAALLLLGVRPLYRQRAMRVARGEAPAVPATASG